MLKATKKLIEIKEYRETRRENIDNDFMLTITSNLLNNLCDRNNYIHCQLDQYKSDKRELDKNLRVATGLYVCSLITCWETFFRDLFIFISNHDNSISQRLMTEYNSEIPLDLTIGEFYARKYNFQNLTQTREAFDYILQRETTELTDYFSYDVFNGLFVEYDMIFKWIHEGNLKTKIDETLHTAFTIRHRVTHDANYLIDFDSTLLSEIECVFQMIPQFFMSHFAIKYSQKRVVFNTVGSYVRITHNPTKDEVPYVFNAKDFMSNDWQVAE